MIKVRKCESIDFKRKFMGKIYRIRLRKCESIDLMAAILIISLSLLGI